MQTPTSRCVFDAALYHTPFVGGQRVEVGQLVTGKKGQLQLPHGRCDEGSYSPLKGQGGEVLGPRGVGISSS